MKGQKKLLIVLIVGLIGGFVLPPADSNCAVRDVTSRVIYETGVRGDLQFKIVDDVYTKKAMDWLAENYKNKRIPDGISGQNQLLLKIAGEIKLPQKFELLFRFEREQKTDKFHPRGIMTVERTTTLGGSDINEVWVDRDSFDNPIIDFVMSSRGAVEFKRLTGAKNKGKRLAIIIGNAIRSAPTIMEEMAGGGGQVLGDFSADEAEDFVDMLIYNGVPYRIE